MRERLPTSRACVAAKPLLVSLGLLLPACQWIVGVRDFEAADGDGVKNGDSGHDVTEHGGAHDAAKTTDARSSTPDHGAPNPCAPRGHGAVGVLGCACTPPGALACSGNDSTETLQCGQASSGLVWQATAPCSAGERCDTAIGPDEGTCQSIDPACVGASAGEDVCVDAGAVAMCGSDLLTTLDAGVCSQPTPACAGGMCQCPSGFGIEAGTCCAATQSVCSGACVDEESDNAHCGGCALTCSTTCTKGECLVVLASDQMGPALVAVDSTSVYWTNELDGTVLSVPIGGGSQTTIASAQSLPQFIVVDSSDVYWTNGGTAAESYADGSVVKTTKGGGGSLVTLATLQNNPQAIAVDSSHVYWTSFGSGTVVTVPITGDTPTTLNVGASGDYGVAIDANNVYWTNRSAGTVTKASLTGESPTTLASGQDGPTTITVDALRVYWTNGAGGSLMSVPIAGGDATTIASGQLSPFGLAVDSSKVYWSNGGAQNATNGSVVAAPLSGGAPTTLVANQGGAGGLVIDSLSAYWTDYGSSTVSRLTPK
jgi:hypothetical protein